MTFANPWLFGLVLPLAFASWRLFRRGRKAGVRFSAVSRIPANSAGWRAVVAALAPFILLAGLAFLIVAAARPRTPFAREHHTTDAVAIAMAMDISGSMRNTDMVPTGRRPTENDTRLAVVKRKFTDFVRRRPDDMIGLVTFATYATTRTPLTFDHRALLHVLDAVKVPPEPNRLSREEPEVLTALGDGLSYALAAIRDSKLKSKVVVLLSDGVSNTGVVKPEEAAAAAAAMEAKVYVIGIGRIPEYVDVQRGFFGTQRIPTAGLSHDQLVELTQFDPDELRSIAKKTGGRYFQVDSQAGLEAALSEIDALEKTKIDTEVYSRWDEHFAYFLLPGALCVLAAVSLSMIATRRMA